jgi:hypothetical protein
VPHKINNISAALAAEGSTSGFLRLISALFRSPFSRAAED